MADTTIIVIVIIVALALIMVVGGAVSTAVLCLKKRGTPESQMEKGEMESEAKRGGKSAMKQRNRNTGERVGCKERKDLRTEDKTHTELPGRGDAETVENETYISAERRGGIELAGNVAYVSAGERARRAGGGVGVRSIPTGQAEMNSVEMTRKEAYTSVSREAQSHMKPSVKEEGTRRAEIMRGGGRLQAARYEERGKMELTRNETRPQREHDKRRGLGMARNEDHSERERNGRRGMEMVRNDACTLREHGGRRDLEMTRNEAYTLREGEGIVMINNDAYSKTGRGNVRLTTNEAYGSRVRPTREEVEDEYYNYYFMN